MNYLLDTNAVSEWVKLRPNPGLIHWLDSIDEDRVFLSVVTLAELRYGVERMPSGAYRIRLEDWLQRELRQRFEQRILPVSEKIAEVWGIAISRSESLGRLMGAMNAFLSATAEVHQLTLVTRDVGHFPLLTVLNPWT